MLRQRVITAVILLALVLPALFYQSPGPFCALALLFIVAAAWEWTRLAGLGPTACVASAATCAGLGLAGWRLGMLTAELTPLWLVAALVWVIGGAWLLGRGAPAWVALRAPVRTVVGVAGLMVAWLAVAQARIVGINFLLSVFLLVWVADIFAYFFGRAWGGKVLARKLAATISPGKSWEGVWGGMAGVLLLATGWAWADSYWMSAVPSLYTNLIGVAPWFMVICVLWLSAMSVVGDLVESLVKRVAGAKDSSGLLPGHGGVLDRLDALLPTVPIAMLLHCVWRSAP